MEQQKINLTDDDLKEIFSYFSSVTEYERNQTLDAGNEHFFRSMNLDEEYSLTQSKKEYAYDAFRGVIYFLKRRGYSLMLEDRELDLQFIEEEFIP